jgi:ribosomal protein S18 acetylase RimI-like enzyme
MKETESLELSVARGIVGGADRSKRRQVTLLSDNAWDAAVADLGTDVDPSMRRANVLVQGLDLEKSRGSLIESNGVRLLVGGEVTPCDKMDKIIPGLRSAMKPHWRGGVFARVLNDGVIRAGDPVVMRSAVDAEGFEIIRATPDDARVLSALPEPGESGGDPEPRMRAYLEGASHPRQALAARVMYYASAGNKPIGYIAGHLTTRYECDGELQWIHAIREYRGTKVASTLLKQLAVWFVERDARRICVDVDPQNAVARRFYSRHGAKEFKPYWMVWDDIAVVL